VATACNAPADRLCSITQFALIRGSTATAGLLAWMWAWKCTGKQTSAAKHARATCNSELA